MNVLARTSFAHPKSASLMRVRVLSIKMLPPLMSRWSITGSCWWRKHTPSSICRVKLFKRSTSSLSPAASFVWINLCSDPWVHAKIMHTREINYSRNRISQYSLSMKAQGITVMIIKGGISQFLSLAMIVLLLTPSMNSVMMNKWSSLNIGWGR